MVAQNSLEQKASCVLLVVHHLTMAISMPAIIAEIRSTVGQHGGKQPGRGPRGRHRDWMELGECHVFCRCHGRPLFDGLLQDATGWEMTTLCLGLLSGVIGLFLLLFLANPIGKVRPRRACSVGRKSNKIPVPIHKLLIFRQRSGAGALASRKNERPRGLGIPNHTSTTA